MKKIAISGLNNTDNPAPGIAIAKSLKDSYNLVGLSYDPNEPGNFQNLIDSVYLMPYPSLGFEELKQRLKYIKEKEDIGAIIPNLDAELPLYIKYKDEIEKLGIKICLPTKENFDLREKKNLKELSQKLNINYPKTFEISSIEELTKTIEKENLSFPLMIKGNYYKAYKVFNLDSANEAFINISNEWGFPVLLQELVSGEEINLVGVGDGNGELVGAVSIKKLTTTHLGKIWTAITIKNENLLSIAKDFVKRTKWKGAFELEAMANQDKIYLIEINPRFPAWIYFATQLGVNLPKMVLDILQNKDITPKLDYSLNKLYVRYVEELVTDFSDLLTILSQKELR